MEESKASEIWQNLKIVKNPQGKSELVIENLDNLNDASELIIKKKGQNFKIAIAQKDLNHSHQHSLQSKIKQRHRDRSNDHVSVVSSQNRLSIKSKAYDSHAESQANWRHQVRQSQNSHSVNSRASK